MQRTNIKQLLDNLNPEIRRVFIKIEEDVLFAGELKDLYGESYSYLYRDIKKIVLEYDMTVIFYLS